jgi:hypothetical protein
MRSKRDISIAVSIFMTIALALFLPSLSIAGDLEPSAPPGPTMHTLDEIYRAMTLGGVAKSGQTISYAIGDDGDLQSGVAWPNPRFTDNGDGTVTDNLTGLMWTKDVNLYGEMTWNDALNSCKTCSVGGYSDWYLPQIGQLQSLIHYGFCYPAMPDTVGTGQWTPGNPFTNVVQDWHPLDFWSSSTIAYDASKVWVIRTASGMTEYINGNGTEGSKHVWCVRGRVDSH